MGSGNFTAPPLVQDAAERAVRAGRTQYTDATGLGALRERIADWYRTRFGLDIAPTIAQLLGVKLPSAKGKPVAVDSATFEPGRPSGRRRSRSFQPKNSQT